MRSYRGIWAVALLCVGGLVGSGGCGCAAMRQVDDGFPSRSWPAPYQARLDSASKAVKDSAGITKSTTPSPAVAAQIAPSPPAVKKGLFASVFNKNSKQTKYKNSTVIYQTGSGNTASTSADELKLKGASSYAQDSGSVTTATKGASVAVGPGAKASASVEQAGIPWWLVVVGLVGGLWAGAKFNSRLRWLPFLAVLLMLSMSRAHAQGPQLFVHKTRFDYGSAKQTERYQAKQRRIAKRKAKQEMDKLEAEYWAGQKELARNRKKQAKRLKRDHP